MGQVIFANKKWLQICSQKKSFCKRKFKNQKTHQTLSHRHFRQSQSTINHTLLANNTENDLQPPPKQIKIYPHTRRNNVTKTNTHNGRNKV
jgi:hypothetical protein